MVIQNRKADDVHKNQENFLGLKSFEGVKKMGLRRCKNLTFSFIVELLFSCCFKVLCCLGHSLFHVNGEFHRFLRRGWEKKWVRMRI